MTSPGPHPLLLPLALLGLSLPVAAQTPPQTATIQRILDGNQVYLNDQRARVGERASRGNTIRTADSRAELLFDQRAYGRLGRQTRLRLGSGCFRLSNGQVLVSGSQAACVNSRILAVRGTTYHLDRQADDSVVVSVLSGRVDLSPRLPETEEESYLATLDPAETRALDLEPRVPATVGIGAQGAFNQVSGVINALIPVAQTPGQNLWFTQAQASSGFGTLSGGSMLVGYRYLRENGRIDTTYGAYDGFTTPICGRSQVGVGYESLGRDFDWRLNGYIPADSCSTQIGGADITLAVPIARLGGTQDLRLNLTPYVLAGQLPGTVGGRVELSLNGNPNVEARVGAQYDQFFGSSVTFRLIGRLPIGTGEEVPSPLQRDLPLTGRQPEAMLVASEQPIGATTAASTPVTLQAGERVTLRADGSVSAVTPMTAAEFESLAIANADGYAYLPEAPRIFRTFTRLYGDSYSDRFFQAGGGEWTARSPELIPRLDATTSPVNYNPPNNQPTCIPLSQTNPQCQ